MPPPRYLLCQGLSPTATVLVAGGAHASLIVAASLVYGHMFAFQVGVDERDSSIEFINKNTVAHNRAIEHYLAGRWAQAASELDRISEGH